MLIPIWQLRQNGHNPSKKQTTKAHQEEINKLNCPVSITETEFEEIFPWREVQIWMVSLKNCTKCTGNNTNSTQILPEN